MKPEGKDVISVLLTGDLDVSGEFLGEEDHLLVIRGKRFIQGVGEQAGLEARDPEQCLLSESDALDGEQLLGIDGPVVEDEIFLEASDLIEILEADDGERGGSEAVFAGIAGGAGLTLRRARAGGMPRVGPVSRELLFGNGCMRVGQSKYLSTLG